MTILELLRDKLPYKYVLAIISNMEEKSLLDEDVEGSLLDELESIFDWTNSYEGCAFWEDVYDSIASGALLPELPFRTKWKPNTYLCTEEESCIINAQNKDIRLLIDVDISEMPRTWEAKFFQEQHLAFCN